MADHGSKRDPVTIVGGRPMHRAVSTADLPVGLEQVLTVAGLNYHFREQLERDPEAAAASIGIQLDQTELMLLRSAAPGHVRELAASILPVVEGRRGFVKAVAASVAAMVVGPTYLLCSGCTGADSWAPDGDMGLKPDQKIVTKPQQKMATIAGHVCYTYVPGHVVENPGSPCALLVALHDENEQAISNIKRWSHAADKHNFCIASVNWTEEPKTAKDLDKLAGDLLKIARGFSSKYPADTDQLYLASRGKSTPIVYQAAFLRDPGAWAAAVFLGGVPATSCTYGLKTPPPSGWVTDMPALYYVLGIKDTDFSAQNKCMEMFSYYKKMPVSGKFYQGTTATAVLSFDEIWSWISQYRAGGNKPA